MFSCYDRISTLLQQELAKPKAQKNRQKNKNIYKEAKELMKHVFFKHKEGKKQETKRDLQGKRGKELRFNVQLKFWHLPEVQMFHQSNGNAVG